MNEITQEGDGNYNNTLKSGSKAALKLSLALGMGAATALALPLVFPAAAATTVGGLTIIGAEVVAGAAGTDMAEKTYDYLTSDSFKSLPSRVGGFFRGIF